MLLDAKSLSKRYGAVHALKGADLAVAPGEIHALLGANGCGKSTLCKIIAGTVRADGGILKFRGEERQFDGPRAAEKAGIALFYQELSLVPRLSVAQNIFLGREPRMALGFIDRKVLRERTAELIEKFSSVVANALTADAIVGDLPPDQRQIVEILKVFAQNAQLMIMDEATAALDGRQAARFFEILRAQKGSGVSTVMISHRLDEVFAVADRVTVMRDGVSALTAAVKDINREDVVNAMVGSVVRPAPRAPISTARETKLNVENVSGSGFSDVSLKLAPGEIVGLGGLQGQGQSQFLRALFGVTPFSSGKVEIEGLPVLLRRPRDAMRQHLAYISGDRGRDAALSGRSVFENLAAATLSREKRIFVRPSELMPRMLAAAQSLKTQSADAESLIESLSGGNQQKVFIARWLVTNPKLLLLDDPTKGIDLGAKADLFLLMRQLADRGASVLFYSSEDAELLENADRVLVFNGGRVVAELDHQSLTAAALARASYGEAA